jgi:hypothetical protein
VDDDSIREVVRRLSRPAPAGHVIERVAILAEGPNFDAIEAWILERGGQPETPVPTTAPRGGGGLHADRRASLRSEPGAKISRYVLPPDALA